MSKERKFSPLSPVAYGQDYPWGTIIGDHYLPLETYQRLVEAAGTPTPRTVPISSAKILGAAFSAEFVGVGEAAMYRRLLEPGVAPGLPHLIGCLTFSGTIEKPTPPQHQPVVAVPFEADPSAVPMSLRQYIGITGLPQGDVLRVQYYQDAQIIEPQLTDLKSLPRPERQ